MIKKVLFGGFLPSNYMQLLRAIEKDISQIFRTRLIPLCSIKNKHLLKEKPSVEEEVIDSESWI